MNEELKKRLLTESKSFCVAPWMSLYVHPNGDVLPCCNWDLDSPIGNANDNSIDQIYNSEVNSNIRKKMINGEPVTQCSNCINHEKINHESYRQILNKKYKDCVDYIDNNTTNFHLWDIRISNLCNFKCRMCYHGFSSSWFNDAVSMNINKGDNPIITLDNVEGFLTELQPHYDYVEEIYFAGGEPLISEHHYTILNELIKKDKNPLLRYSTNLSKLTYKSKNIFDYWSHFNEITLFVSLDGLGKVGEYIRSGFNTETFVTNAKSVSNFLKNSHIFYSFSYGALNYLHVFDMILELIDLGLIDKKMDYNKRSIITVNPIYGPDYLSCKWLSEDIKDNFKARLDGYEEELVKIGVSTEVISEIIISLNSIYTFSKTDTEQIDKHKTYKKFIEYNNTLDNLRSEKLESAIGINFNPKNIYKII